MVLLWSSCDCTSCVLEMTQSEGIRDLPTRSRSRKYGKSVIEPPGSAPAVWGMLDSMSGLNVAYEGPVARFTLSRPERLNALNDEVRRSISEELSLLEEKPDIRVLVFDGAGKAFSSGADLKTGAFAHTEGADWATRRHH